MSDSVRQAVPPRTLAGATGRPDPLAVGGGPRPADPARLRTALVAVAVIAYALSLLGWLSSVLMRPVPLWATVDLHTYYDAVRSLAHSQHAIYHRSFGPWPGPFLYPPFAAAVMLVPAKLGLAGFRILVIVISHLSLLWACRSAWRLLGWRPGPERTAAVFALAAGTLWLDPVLKTFFFGQVSLLLMALVLADLARPAGARGRGVLIGLAAGFKLTPGLFIVYLLVTRRFRAAAVATGTFAATVVLGWITLPGASADFWFGRRTSGTGINAHVSMADASNQALRPILLRLLGPGTTTQSVWLLSSSVLVVAGLLAARRASRLGWELLGVLLVAGVGLAVSPISWTHHWVWTVPALAFVADRALRSDGVAAKAWLALGAAYTAVMFAWPMPLTRTGAWSWHADVLPWGLVWTAPHQDGREFHWSAAEFVVGNAMLSANLALVLSACVVLFRSRAVSGTPAPRRSGLRPLASALRAGRERAC